MENLQSMMRICLHIAYIGTDFCGWQVQAKQTGRRSRSIQGCLQDALERITGQKISVQGSGRTDSGVHASGQVAHFDVERRFTHIPWQMAINSQLPPEISVLKAQEVSFDFHARFSVSGKCYSYTFWTEKTFLLPQRVPYVWQVWNLDFAKMRQAAEFLQGQHDFACFQNSGTEVRSTVRNIFRIWDEPGMYPQERVWYFYGSGFLKQMVRNIVGLLKEIGKGNLAPEVTKKLLAAKDRRLAPATAPAQGLCLERVFYTDLKNGG